MVSCSMHGEGPDIKQQRLNSHESCSRRYCSSNCWLHLTAAINSAAHQCISAPLLSPQLSHLSYRRIPSHVIKSRLMPCHAMTPHLISFHFISPDWRLSVLLYSSIPPCAWCRSWSIRYSLSSQQPSVPPGDPSHRNSSNSDTETLCKKCILR